MRVEMKNMVSIEDIFSVYSGKRLQYAIKLGILPKPEILNQLVKRKENTVMALKMG